MSSLAFVKVLLLAVFFSAARATQSCPDSLGIWPLPKKCAINYDSPTATLSSDFQFNIAAATKLRLSPSELNILNQAFARYLKILKPLKATQAEGSQPKPRVGDPDPNMEIFSLDISIGSTGGMPAQRKTTGLAWPSQSADETYTLSIDGSEGSVLGGTGSVWGVLRGLETFSQLFDLESGMVPYSKFVIDDAPRWNYRGVMLDTGRHFVSSTHFKALIDGMAYNKFNVLHWHITDDQSFPIVSSTYPELANQGSFGMDGRHIYSPGTVADIIDFARVRGVRVIPEFDMPGHSTSWFVGYPGLRTDCPAGSVKEFSKPMDPSKNYTYSFLQKFLKEMSGRFQDEFFHIGGDEVDGTCWQSTSSVQQFCKDHNLTSSPALQMYFEEKVVSMLTNLGKTPVIWEENFGSTTGYPEGAIVEVWKHKWGNTTILDTLIKEGYKTIYTTTDWYLDYSTNAINGGFTRRIDDISEWEYYYRVEPFTNSSLDEKEQEKLLGAEVCSWNPYFDGTNLLSNVFPRSVAVGERLWSDKSVRNLTSALSRIQNQRCRMVARGIPVSPVNFADHCPYPYEFTYVSP